MTHHPLARAACFGTLLFVLSPLTRAQEGRITVSAGAGASFLSLKAIDEDGQKDIEAYNRLGVPVGPYDPLDVGFSFGGALEYRFDRDLSIAVFGQYMRATTGASFRDTAQTLSLWREITSADIGIDFLYYLPRLLYDAEAALFLGVGRMKGTATQSTGQDHKVKSADSTLTVVDQEAFAEYSKSKLYLRAGARVMVPLSGPLRVTASALYKYAPLGALDGTLREFSLVRPHTTTVEFNFSTIDLMVGLSYVIE